MKENTEGVYSDPSGNLCLARSKGDAGTRNDIRKVTNAAVLANDLVLLGLAVCIGVAAFDQFGINGTPLIESSAAAKLCV